MHPARTAASTHAALDTLPRKEGVKSLLRTGAIKSLYDSDKWELGRKSRSTRSWKKSRRTQYK